MQLTAWGDDSWGAGMLSENAEPRMARKLQDSLRQHGACFAAPKHRATARLPAVHCAVALLRLGRQRLAEEQRQLADVTKNERVRQAGVQADRKSVV